MQGIHNIESNGWLNLGKLNIKVDSEDNDKSEKYKMKIGLLDQDGNITNLPDKYRLNIDLKKNSDGFYVVREENLSNLFLYIGIIPNQIELVLIPISEDLSSQKEGDKAILKIASNEVLKIPLLDVSFNPNYDEDLRIPLLKENGGPIEAQLIKSLGNQKLELEFSNIPLNSQT